MRSYAEIMLELLKREEGTFVMHGDAGFLDECYYTKRPECLREDVQPPHALNRWRYVLDGLERRPDLFDKRFVRVHDNMMRSCLVRCFEIREGKK